MRTRLRTACAAAVLWTLSPPAFAQSRTVFSGVPTVKVSEGGVERHVESLSRATALNLGCVISEIAGRYYWASRENKPLVRHQAGAFTTYVAEGGAGYIRLINRDQTAAASLLSPSEAAFDYVEHMLIGLRGVTYYGVIASDQSGSAGQSPLAPASEGVSEAARLAHDVLQSLALARDARVALSEGMAASEASGQQGAAVSLAVMTSQRRALSKLRNARSHLEQHEGSREEMIASTAAGTREVYALLIAAFEGSLRVQEELVDMSPGDPMGAMLSEASKHTARAEEAWKALPIASAAGLSHALVDSQRVGPDGKRTFLVITKRERAEMLESIERVFGTDVAAGKVAGLHAAEGSAGLLAQFLRQSWRNADER